MDSFHVNVRKLPFYPPLAETAPQKRETTPTSKNHGGTTKNNSGV